MENYYSKFIDKETTPKYYFEDNEFLNLFLVNEEPRLLENLVAIILKKKYGNDFYYIKTDSMDIDFFIPSTGKLYKSHIKMKEALKFTVITFEEENEITVKNANIKVIPIWKYALED